MALQRVLKKFVLFKSPFCLRARVYPCRNCPVCNAALAAEVRLFATRRLFQPPSSAAEVRLVKPRFSAPPSASSVDCCKEPGTPIHAVSSHEWAFARKREPHSLPKPKPVTPTRGGARPWLFASQTPQLGPPLHRLKSCQALCVVREVEFPR